MALGMLVNQGIIAVRLWTGIEPDEATCCTALEKPLAMTALSRTPGVPGVPLLEMAAREVRSQACTLCAGSISASTERSPGAAGRKRRRQKHAHQSSGRLLSAENGTIKPSNGREIGV